MPVKIRLTRRGRKKQPFYHIVVADSRAPRDGKYIEKLGTYDPTTNPPAIDLDFDKTLDWVQKGAKATDTCRSILSYKGVMLKKHLLRGVKKNAISEEEAERQFNEWMTQQEEKIKGVREAEINKSKEETQQRLDAEKKISDARAEQQAKELADKAEAEKPDKTKEKEQDTSTASSEKTNAPEAPEKESQVASEDTNQQTQAHQSADNTKSETPQDSSESSPDKENQQKVEDTNEKNSGEAADQNKDKDENPDDQGDNKA